MHPTQLLLISLLPLLTSANPLQQVRNLNAREASPIFLSVTVTSYGKGVNAHALKEAKISASNNQFFMGNQSEPEALFVLQDEKLSLYLNTKPEQVYIQHNGTLRYTDEHVGIMDKVKGWDHHIRGRLTFKDHDVYACPVEETPGAKPEATGKGKQGDYSSVPNVWTLVVGKKYKHKEKKVDEKAAKAAKDAEKDGNKGKEHDTKKDDKKVSKQEGKEAKNEKTEKGCIPVHLKAKVQQKPVNASPASASASASAGEKNAEVGVKKTG